MLILSLYDQSARENIKSVHITNPSHGVDRKTSIAKNIDGYLDYLANFSRL